MNKEQLKTKVAELLSSGIAKSEIFTQLSGQGIKDSQLAYVIAAQPDPILCYKHNGKVNALVTIMFIFALIAFFLGFGIGAKIGPNAKWIFGILLALMMLLFAWGFYNHKVSAYNVYILLTIIQLPKSFEGFMTTPITSSIGMAINLALLGYVWYVREKLFPGFILMSPKKIDGQYVFSN